MRRLAVWLAIAVVAVSAGCGGGGSGSEPLSKESYQERVRAVGQDFNEVAASLGPVGSEEGVSPEQLDRVGAAMALFADRLAALEPPEEVKQAHDLLVAGVRGYSNALKLVANNARGGIITSFAQLQELLGKLQPAKQIARAAAQLRAKGYSFAEPG